MALNSLETTEFFAVEMKPNKGGADLPNNIKKITVPSWFVNGDIQTFRNKLVQYYEEIKIPKKSGYNQE